MAGGIAGGLAALGLVFFAIGVTIVIRQRRFRRLAATTLGLIVSQRVVYQYNSAAGFPMTGPAFRPTVRFMTEDRRLIEAESTVSTSPAAGGAGREVTVHYDPADPYQFTTSSVRRVPGFVAWTLILLGGLVAVTGLTVAVTVLR